MRKHIAAVVACTAALAGLFVSSRATFGDLPLPGTGVRGDTYRITATFSEALNLPEGATVKLNGLTVGRVHDIRAVDYQAVVDIDIKADTVLREGTTARLRNDTPLGELFVELTSPASGPALPDGSTLDTHHTSTAPTVEDTLASASLLINGGGLGQSSTIVDEMNNALGGRESTFRDSIDQLTHFLRGANASTRQIDDVLHGLLSVSAVLHARRDSIHDALTEITPALRVLRANTGQLVALLDRTDDLSTRTNGLLEQTRTSFLTVVRELWPTLDQILATRPIYADSLRRVVAASDLLKQVIPGDYFPTVFEIDLDLSGLLFPPTNPGAGTAPPAAPNDDEVGGLIGGLLGLVGKGAT